jgi:hypothetical protein
MAVFERPLEELDECLDDFASRPLATTQQGLEPVVHFGARGGVVRSVTTSCKPLRTWLFADQVRFRFTSFEAWKGLE